MVRVAFCVKFDEDSFPLPGAIMPAASLGLRPTCFLGLGRVWGLGFRD